MGSEPGNGAPPKVSPLASVEVSNLPQSIRWNNDAKGSMIVLEADTEREMEELKQTYTFHGLKNQCLITKRKYLRNSGKKDENANSSLGSPLSFVSGFL